MPMPSWDQRRRRAISSRITVTAMRSDSKPLETLVLTRKSPDLKGLGEISPEEFAHFIGPDMRLEQVTLHKTDQVQKLLEYYMGKNTMERQNFIIDNLVIEEDIPEEDSEPLD